MCRILGEPWFVALQHPNFTAEMQPLLSLEKPASIHHPSRFTISQIRNYQRPELIQINLSQNPEPCQNQDKLGPLPQVLT